MKRQPAYRRRAARFGMAYHRGRPERESRLYVARHHPDRTAGAFLALAINLEGAADRMRAVLLELNQRPRCPKCGERHPRWLECPVRASFTLTPANRHAAAVRRTPDLHHPAILSRFARPQ